MLQHYFYLININRICFVVNSAEETPEHHRDRTQRKGDRVKGGGKAGAGSFILPGSALSFEVEILELKR